jgi:PadR family transcriptional regulator
MSIVEYSRFLLWVRRAGRFAGSQLITAASALKWLRTKAPQTDLLHGTLDLLILKARVLQELHGMGVLRRIAQITGGAFDVKVGSLFPALHRMEQAGWLTSFWGESETNRRAKFYSFTKAGKKQLHTESERWDRIPFASTGSLWDSRRSIVNI